MTAPSTAYNLAQLSGAHYHKSQDKFILFLFLAALLHAVIAFGVSFSMPENATVATPTLDVVLVQKPDEQERKDAQYLAEFSQDGGGETDIDTRPKDLFNAQLPQDGEGIAPDHIIAGSAKSTPRPEKLLLTRLYSNIKINTQPDSERQQQDDDKPEQPSDIDLQIAKMSAELSQKQQKYAKRPKKLQLTASTAAHFAAAYMGRWVERIERIGNLNIPPEARKLNGKLVLMVELKHDGTLVRTKVMQSSGFSVLDETAKHIVFLSTPYEAFPPKLRAEADHIEIVRSWHFSNLGLSTQFTDEKR